MGALAVVNAGTLEVGAALVAGSEAHEAVQERVVALLVHVVVPLHVRLVGEALLSNKRLRK